MLRERGRRWLASSDGSDQTRASRSARATVRIGTPVRSYSLNSYVDLASLQQWSGAPSWTSGVGGLTDDATLTGPGYLIQPIAIYR